MVVVGLIPVTGVTLPFLSYGGSSLLVSMTYIGILLNISKFNSGFSILYNNYEYDIDETLVVSPGSKIQLLNQSANAQENLNVWVLQVQDNLLGDGKEIDGCTSHVTHPSCYLYNIGQNKIKLTTTSPKRCKETIVAENLYVQGVNNRAINSYFENKGHSKEELKTEKII